MPKPCVFCLMNGREVSYGFDEMEELELAYAITVHKSQGSEYPAVVIPVFHVPASAGLSKSFVYGRYKSQKVCDADRQ